MGARASSFFYETDAENRIVSMLEAGREGPKLHWYRYDAAARARAAVAAFRLPVGAVYAGRSEVTP
ncbi:hypothethical protein (plasmid) [Ralstonia solanacearum CMR15]|nr:hypothethical protein [Ralstonia solanacearum CMR15]